MGVGWALWVWQVVMVQKKIPFFKDLKFGLFKAKTEREQTHQVQPMHNLFRASQRGAGPGQCTTSASSKPRGGSRGQHFGT